MVLRDLTNHLYQILVPCSVSCEPPECCPQKNIALATSSPPYKVSQAILALRCAGVGYVARVLNKDTAKAIWMEKGAELRIRAPGQRATAIEARSGIVRGTVRLIEESFNI